jgi:hypothetical protein
VAFWLGASPSTFHVLYTAEALALLGLRCAVYRAKKWHYFLLDLCYFVHILLFVHLWLMPRSAPLNHVSVDGRWYTTSMILPPQPQPPI